VAWRVFIKRKKKGGNSFLNKMLDWLALKSFPGAYFARLIILCRWSYSFSMLIGFGTRSVGNMLAGTWTDF